MQFCFLIKDVKVTFLCCFSVGRGAHGLHDNLETQLSVKQKKRTKTCISFVPQNFLCSVFEFSARKRN